MNKQLLQSDPSSDPMHKHLICPPPRIPRGKPTRSYHVTDRVCNVCKTASDRAETINFYKMKSVDVDISHRRKNEDEKILKNDRGKRRVASPKLNDRVSRGTCESDGCNDLVPLPSCGTMSPCGGGGGGGGGGGWGRITREGNSSIVANDSAILPIGTQERLPRHAVADPADISLANAKIGPGILEGVRHTVSGIVQILLLAELEPFVVSDPKKINRGLRGVHFANFLCSYKRLSGKIIFN
ncbi:hypothetical protein J6590_020806 [Homalodisca vitripennis]|nr:hypothetical protein J6590_020806 [Homalodisca vitripennis]